MTSIVARVIYRNILGESARAEVVKQATRADPALRYASGLTRRASSVRPKGIHILLPHLCLSIPLRRG